jgi:hypothetical protein
MASGFASIAVLCEPNSEAGRAGELNPIPVADITVSKRGSDSLLYSV